MAVLSIVKRNPKLRYLNENRRDWNLPFFSASFNTWRRNMNAPSVTSRSQNKALASWTAKSCWGYPPSETIFHGQSTVAVVTPAGERATIDYSPGYKVYELQNEVHSQLGIPPNKQRLLLRDQQLHVGKLFLPPFQTLVYSQLSLSGHSLNRTANLVHSLPNCTCISVTELSLKRTPL